MCPGEGEEGVDPRREGVEEEEHLHQTSAGVGEVGAGLPPYREEEGVGEGLEDHPRVVGVGEGAEVPLGHPRL